MTSKVIIVALTVFFAGTAIHLNSRISRLHDETARLRGAIGLSENHGSDDFFSFSTTGYRKNGSGPLFGSHLLSIDAHENYSLEVTVYDSSTSNRNTVIVDINDPMVAISYVPFSEDFKYFLIQSVYFGNKKTDTTINVNLASKLSFNPFSCSRCKVRDGAILTYFFYPDGPHTIPSTTELTSSPFPNSLKPENIVKVCDKHKIHSVFFRVVPRSGR